MMFLVGSGESIEMDSIEVLQGVRDGLILVCEFVKTGEVLDRFLVHRDFVPELQVLGVGEELRIRRAG